MTVTTLMMEAIANALALGVSLIVVFMVVGWLVSLYTRDASIVDRVWGVNFIILAVAYAACAPNLTWRPVLLLILVTVWGLRLSAHIHFRNRGHGEDRRYQKMRHEAGSSFWIRSLFTVFLLQGVLSVLISAPLLVGILAAPQAPTAIDALAVVLWGVGFYFEAMGDRQLKRFRADPANRGRVMNTGLWALTRHPNYFGDGLVWVAYWGVALSVPNGWLTFFGPLIMIFFLRYVSGVSLLERDLKVTKPGYADYVASTPAYIPNLYILSSARFVILCLVKWLASFFYRFEVHSQTPLTADDWQNIRIAVLLNHTSLFEPIISGVLPHRYLWRLASRGTFPVASETLSRPLAGNILKALSPKVLPLSRKRDGTWSDFLGAISAKDTLIFMPEGRMKRPNGLDKHGKPMTMRGGIVDLLVQMKTGKMLICCSGGLHHIHAPGQGLPKIFKTVRVKFEVLTIESYLAQFDPRDYRTEITADLERRRDEFVKPQP